MPKRNREKLMEQSLYDMLYAMNEQIDKKGGITCIMECFMETEEAEARCKGKCNKCIVEWLNEFPF